MSDPNLDETQPVRPGQPGIPNQSAEPTDPTAATQRISTGSVESTQPVRLSPLEEPVIDGAQDENEAVNHKNRKPRRWLVVFGGILLVLVLGACGGYFGYLSAQGMKQQAYAQSVTQLATEQFMLGLTAQSEGRYELAIQHIEYVIQIDPNFPGARDKLAEIMLLVATAKTPTPEVILPTITPSPTPDFRGEEDIFNNAKSLMANKEWVQTLQVLDTLRDKNLSYRAVEVDGMYYVALRHRGLQKVSGGELEGGLYDLALVERFGPLDIDAQGVRNWARLYLTGARFWGVRWDKVVEAFAELYPYFPSLHDSSGMTATERFRIASIKYGDQLAATGQYCEALQQYQNALAITQEEAIGPTVTAVYIGCFPPTETPGPTLSPTPTFTAPVEVTVEPSPTTEDLEPTPIDTQAPTAEPTPESPTAATTP